LRILIAAAGPPNPAGKGYQVRLFNQVLRLAERHHVSLVTFASRDELIEPAVVRACTSVQVIRRSTLLAGAGAIAHALRLPLSVALHQDARMRACIGRAARADDLDIVVLQLVRMATYISEAGELPVVLDLLDAARVSMMERAALAPTGIRPLLELEARRLGRFERSAVEQAELSLLISERDRAYVGAGSKTRVNANGIDPLRSAPNDETREPSTVVFSGTMSYPPNADAALWFATSILPLVRGQMPEVRFRIVGRDPSWALRRAAAANDVVVTGAVDSISDELAHASLAVCPLRRGSGLQTKVLEAMAAGTPVIATSKAVEGLPGALAAHVIHADSAEDFAHAVLYALTNPTIALENAARALTEIAASHTWQHSVDQLESYYAEAIRLSGRTTVARELREPTRPNTPERDRPSLP
jgi:glycosyltransferase involved in cell wall biosynthesis